MFLPGFEYHAIYENLLSASINCYSHGGTIFILFSNVFCRAEAIHPMCSVETYYIEWIHVNHEHYLEQVCYLCTIEVFANLKQFETSFKKFSQYIRLGAMPSW